MTGYLRPCRETAREQVSLIGDEFTDVLVEEINENDRSMVTGRMSTIHWNIFKDASLVGKIVNVSLDEYHGFYAESSGVKENKMKQEKEKELWGNCDIEGYVLEYVSDSCEHGRKRKPDWDDLQFLLTHHTLQVCLLCPDHRILPDELPKKSAVPAVVTFCFFLIWVTFTYLP